MNIDDIKTIAVIGAGDMGHGIAETALMAGYKVYLRDVTQEFLDKGVKRIYDSLEKLVSKGKVPAEILENARAGMLVPCVDLAESVKEADLVIEAIPEIMALKKETFEIMDQAAPAHTLFASNTSTMSITQIASVTKRPEKVLGLHYFNPAVLMKLVEVIRGDKTSDEAMQIGCDFALKCGKVAVKVEKDVPGFIVNRTQAPSSVLLSAFLDEKIFEPEEVDATMRKMGVPMGPYETADFAGLDVAYHGNEYYAEAIHPDFRLGKVFTEKYEAGHLGKKTGQGIFDWSNGRPAIDLEKATDKFDFMDLMAVNLNEATKIIAEGACRLEDVDLAVTNATGSPFGPVLLMQQTSPADLTARLENLAKKFNKEIFKPTDMIKEGGYILAPPENIHVKKEGHIAVITIDHPPANAWNLVTMTQFETAIDAVETDKAIRAVILTGAGKCFSAGFDVSDAANGAEIGAKGRSLWRRIDRSSKPFVAAINGFALGGGLELAMCCHFRIMADHPKNKIGLTELNLGIIPGWGGTQNLARIVGKSRALDMMLFSKRVEAKEALEMGLINEISTPENLMKDTMAFAGKLAGRAPLAVAGVLDALSTGEYEGLDKGWEIEAKHTGIVSQSADAMEGFTAFFEKRTPEFKGE
jgi:enoyl-CoA hydratase/3-hydroxyacyl-CoA dehydrogenase